MLVKLQDRTRKCLFSVFRQIRFILNISKDNPLIKQEEVGRKIQFFYEIHIMILAELKMWQKQNFLVATIKSRYLSEEYKEHSILWE